MEKRGQDIVAIRSAIRQLAEAEGGSPPEPLIDN